jgi:argininosuccinate lyase
MSTEFGFVDIGDTFTTGSSIMPQKRNPDVLELLRARHHRVVSEASILMNLPANLPSGYHRDLQLTKEAAMRGTLECEESIAMLADVLPSVTFDRNATLAAIDPDMLSTAFVLARSQKGVPFRDAYREWKSHSAGPLSPVDPEDVLSAYRLTGSPGREDPEMIEKAVQSHMSWTAP